MCHELNTDESQIDIYQTHFHSADTVIKGHMITWRPIYCGLEEVVRRMI